jgi:hypothetical protein
MPSGFMARHSCHGRYLKLDLLEKHERELPGDGRHVGLLEDQLARALPVLGSSRDLPIAAT